MLALLIATTVIAGSTGNGYMSPRPIVTMMTAPLGQTVHLGDLTVRIEELRPATPADNPDHIPVLVNENLMVMHVVLSNSVLSDYAGIVDYRLQDKNGIGPRARNLKPKRPNIRQGTPVHLTALFTIDKGYVPASLLVECSSCNASHYKAVQFTIPTP